MCTNKCLCKTCVFVDVDDVVLFCNNNNNNECLLPELHNFHLYTETNVVARTKAIINSNCRRCSDFVFLSPHQLIVVFQKAKRESR